MTMLKTTVTMLTLVVMTATTVIATNQTAQARVKGLRISHVAKVCGGIQDAFDNKIDDLRDAVHERPQNRNKIRRLRDEAIALVEQWQVKGCDSGYGYIGAVPAMPSPTGTTQGGSNGTLSNEPTGTIVPRIKSKPVQ